MISVSFGSFTAFWQYVANECGAATMLEEEGSGASGREIEKVMVREEGSAD